MPDQTTRPVDPDGRAVCGVESDAALSFLAGRFGCSLAPDHVNDPSSAHVAYQRHFVTSHGRDVVWLGPWADGRPWQGEQAERLRAQWEKRHDDPVFLAKSDAELAGAPEWWKTTGLVDVHAPDVEDAASRESADIVCTACRRAIEAAGQPVVRLA